MGRQHPIASTTPHPRSRTAFTLVELLVVIAIVAMLVTLLLPAIQAARESARQIQCANQLKQLALAAFNHDAAHGYLPSSGWGSDWYGDPDAGFGPRQPGGWAYSLYPFMELKAVHAIGRGLPNPGPGGEKYNALTAQRSALIPAMYCPSRREAMTYPARHEGINAGLPKEESKSDYAMNGGTLEAFTGTLVDLDCLKTFPHCRFPDRRQSDGVTSVASKVSMGRIMDGTSRTALIGEKYLNPHFYGNGGSCADRGAPSQGNDWANNRWFPSARLGSAYVTGWEDRQPVRDADGFENCSYRMGSAHPNGFQLVLCDGAVKTIPYDIDRWTYAALGSRNGEEAF